MLKIGITGQNGFVGTHLYHSLGLRPELYKRIPFNRDSFRESKKMDSFIEQCDVIVHLAAMNRHEDDQIIYDTNIMLAQKLAEGLERTKSTAHVLFSSSTQEESDNQYGNSKRKAREILMDWSSRNNTPFTGMIIPNVFGPFGKPFYNSVVATFCHLVATGGTPTIKVDASLKLIYVQELVDQIISKIESKETNVLYKVQHTAEASVSQILSQVTKFKESYQDRGEIPEITTTFELNLFNTYRSYMDIKGHYPVRFTQHTDTRGSFVEIIRLGIGGQVSFSTTVPGVTRGNHYHTRKIERFAVIKGKALIQLRKIGTDEVLDFYLDGKEPAYVDMPIWYTHNIKNIGEEILYTNFWINEPFDPDDADTYFEEV